MIETLFERLDRQGVKYLACQGLTIVAYGNDKGALKAQHRQVYTIRHYEHLWRKHLAGN